VIVYSLGTEQLIIKDHKEVLLSTRWPSRCRRQ